MYYCTGRGRSTLFFCCLIIPIDALDFSSRDKLFVVQSRADCSQQTPGYDQPNSGRTQCLISCIYIYIYIYINQLINQSIQPGRFVGVSNLPLCRSTLTFPQENDWVNKGLGMSSRVCATGLIKVPLPLIKRFPPIGAGIGGGGQGATPPPRNLDGGIAPQNDIILN